MYFFIVSRVVFSPWFFHEKFIVIFSRIFATRSSQSQNCDHSPMTTIQELNNAVSENRKAQEERQHSLDAAVKENQQLQDKCNVLAEKEKICKTKVDVLRKDLPPLERQRSEQAHQLTELFSVLILESQKLKCATSFVDECRKKLKAEKKKFITHVRSKNEQKSAFEERTKINKVERSNKSQELLRLQASRIKIAEALAKRRQKNIATDDRLEILTLEKHQLDMELSSSREVRKERENTLCSLAASRKEKTDTICSLVEFLETLQRRCRQLESDIRSLRKVKREKERRQRMVDATGVDEISENSDDDFE